jgi:hypothetical protein
MKDELEIELEVEQLEQRIAPSASGLSHSGGQATSGAGPEVGAGKSPQPNP